MSSSGRAEAVEDDAPIPRRVWLYLLGFLVVLISGLFIGVQVIGVMLAALFPPLPPLPPNAVERSARVDDQGDDVWAFEVTQSACEVADFYSQHGQCELIYDCGGRVPSLTRVAQCEGAQSFSQFQMRWWATLTSHPTELNVTNLTLRRRILWTADPTR